jgi:hypothetical protein
MKLGLHLEFPAITNVQFSLVCITKWGSKCSWFWTFQTDGESLRPIQWYPRSARFSFLGRDFRILAKNLLFWLPPKNILSDEVYRYLHKLLKYNDF